ncbi:MAG: hypothetical protein ACRDGE_10960 [Candidatus Limnocylindria bacterium]
MTDLVLIVAALAVLFVAVLALGARVRWHEKWQHVWPVGRDSIIRGHHAEESARDLARVKPPRDLAP